MDRDAKQAVFGVVVVMSLALIAVQVSGAIGTSQPWLYALGGGASILIVGRYLFKRSRS